MDSESVSKDVKMIAFIEDLFTTLRKRREESQINSVIDLGGSAANRAIF